MEKLQFRIVSSNPDTPWHVCVKNNNSVIFEQTYFKESTDVVYEFADDQDTEHNISIEISGKRAEDTEIDAQGNIVADSLLHINNFTISEIDITEVITVKSSTYTHNFNGNGNQVTEKFYGTIGCNGVIQFKFSSPIYIWLLENM